MITCRTWGVQRRAAWLGAVLLGAMGYLAGCSGPDTNDRVHGVPADSLSTDLRAIVAWQDSVLAAPAAATGPSEAAARVRLYFRLREDLLIGDRRQAAADTLWRRWEQSPRDVLWIDAGYLRRRYLGDRARVNSMLASLTTDDDSEPVTAFVISRQRGSTDQRAYAALRAASSRAGELSDLSRLWLESRVALAEQKNGDLDAAFARLAHTLPATWQVGGAELAACWWFELSKFRRIDRRFADAVVAARVAVACADRSGDEILPLRTRLVLADALLAGQEYEAALGAVEECRRRAEETRHLRWLRDSHRKLMDIHSARGEIEAEIDHTRRALSLSEAMADTAGILRFRLILAVNLGSLGAVDSSTVWWQRAKELAEITGVARDRMRVQAIQIDLLQERGEYDRADSLCIVHSEAGMPQARRYFLFERIELGLDAGRPDIAYRGLAAARRQPELLVREGVYDPALDLELMSARFHARQGEFRLATRDLAAAAALVDAGGHVRSRGRLVETRGRVAELADDIEGAVRVYREAYDLALEVGEVAVVERRRIQLGEALIASGDLAGARGVLTGALDANEHSARLAGELLLGCADAASGDHRAALDRFENAEAMLHGDSQPAVEARLRLEQARSLRALGRAREAWDRLQPIDLAVVEAPSGRGEDGYHAFDRPLRRDVIEVQLGLLIDHPELADANDPVTTALALAGRARWRVDTDRAPATAAEIAALPGRLDGPAAVFFVGQELALAWYATGDHWTQIELEPRARLLELVRAVDTDMGDPDRPVDQDAARALADRLLGPLRDQWRPGQTLHLLAPPPLADLPWPALPLSGEGDGLELVVDRGPVVHLTGPRPATDVRARPPGEALLAIGASGDGTGRPLHEPENEARRVADLWTGPATVLIGHDASWSRVLAQNLADYGVIHLATHAELTEGLPGQSTLRLATDDGSEPVTIPEVRSLDLSCDLVFLSSCEGGRLVLDNGTGVGSFARAFLAAGARAVLASTRRVDDRTALDLATWFYRARREQDDWATALAAAQDSVRRADPAWSHPYYWAHYQLHVTP